MATLKHLNDALGKVGVMSSITTTEPLSIEARCWKVAEKARQDGLLASDTNVVGVIAFLLARLHYSDNEKV